MNPRYLAFGGAVLALAAWSTQSAITYELNTSVAQAIDFSKLTANGLTQIVEFSIHHAGIYWVEVDQDIRPPRDPASPCSGAALAGTKWTVYRKTAFGEKVAPAWADSASTVFRQWPRDAMGGFHAPRGKYELQIALPPSVQCYRNSHARLLISNEDFDDWQDAGSLAILASKFLCVVGFALFPLSIAIWLKNNLAPRKIRICEIASATGCIPFKPRLMEPFHPTPIVFDGAWRGVFSQIYLAVLIVPMIIFMALPASQEMGFGVRVRPRGLENFVNSPWRETLGVFVSADRKYFVNAQPVARESLRDALTVELRRHPVSTVYFEADEGVLADDAIFAMKAIGDAGGDLVWITPQIRKQLNQISASPARK